MDAVYVLGPGAAPAYEELRYSLRSLANVPHGRVWVVGCAPSWLRNAEHVPVPQTLSRFRNSTANMAKACSLSEVSETFTFWHDDMFALRPTEVPVLHRGRIRDVPASRPRFTGKPTYPEGLASTAWLLTAWGHHEPLNYDLHVPLPVHKETMGEVLRAARGANIEALHKRTLYGNMAEIGGQLHRDVKVTRIAAPLAAEATWVSTSDEAFSRGRVGKALRAMFPEPSPYEEH